MSKNPRISNKTIIFSMVLAILLLGLDIPSAVAGSQVGFSPNRLATPTMINYIDLVVDEARGQLYGVDKNESKIDVISKADLSVTNTYLLTYGAYPTSAALSPDGNELAIAQSALSQVKFIDLTTGTQTELSTPLGSFPLGFDVLYGRNGILYVLSDEGIHVVDLTQSPHAEDTAQYVAASSEEKFGVLSSDNNTLYYVTGTCCSGYNSLHKYDLSENLSKPELLSYTYIFGSGSKKNIRLRLANDDILITSFGTIYNTSNLTPRARNGQIMKPVAVIPAHNFYVVADQSITQNQLIFLDTESSHQVSIFDLFDLGIYGDLGAIVSTSSGDILFVSSTAGMKKISIGATPPGISVPLPVSQHHYRDLAIDLSRNQAYGTDLSGCIDVIDMDTMNVVDSFLLSAGAIPIGIDISPDGSELAIALHGLESILFLDPETGAEIARVTPQLDLSAYYDNLPFDVIYGRAGRLYSDGKSTSLDYVHVYDTTTHAWIAKSSNPYYLRTGAEFSISADLNYLYANQTLSPNQIYVFDIHTDTPAVIYKGPHGPVSANEFTINPDGSQVFTSSGQVWDGTMQSQLGSLEGGAGKLIKFIIGQDAVVMSQMISTNTDVLRFISAVDYREIVRQYPVIGGTIWEMEMAPDGSQLILNTSNGMEIIDISKIFDPHVQSISRADPSPTNTSSVDFTVIFSEPVTGVNETDFTVTPTGSITGSSVTGVSPATGSAVTFTVTVDTGSGDGGLRLDLNATGTDIQDQDGNPINAGYTAGQVYEIDKSPPSVSSILRLDPNPTSQNSVRFNVVFSEAVAGVDASVFTLVSTGRIKDYSVIDASPAIGPSDSYTVTMNTGKYNGTLRLDVKSASTGILDLAGNHLNGGFTGPIYTVRKRFFRRSQAYYDGWVLESTEFSKQGGSLNRDNDLLFVGDDAYDRQFRSILSFKTAALPDNAVITRVTLKVKMQGVVGTNPFSTHSDLLADIRKAPFSNNKVLRLSDFQARAGVNKAGIFDKFLKPGNWYQVTLRSVAGKYVNKKGVTQLRLRFERDDNDDLIADYLTFFSGNSSIPEYRPLLVIDYYVP